MRYEPTAPGTGALARRRRPALAGARLRAGGAVPALGDRLQRGRGDRRRRRYGARPRSLARGRRPGRARRGGGPRQARPRGSAARARPRSYSSLEPCARRASRPAPCARLDPRRGRAAGGHGLAGAGHVRDGGGRHRAAGGARASTSSSCRSTRSGRRRPTGIWREVVTRGGTVVCARPGWRTTGVHNDAGWSSSVARWAHNPEVAGSNPVPATEGSRAGIQKVPALSVFPRPSAALPRASPEALLHVM